MKSMLIPAVALLISFASGCANKQPAQTAASNSNSALDVSPAPAPVYTPAVTASPVLASPDPVVSSTPAAIGGGNTYTVKKGDTMYAIAKAHYGDGKQWQRIASTNPGVTPQTLRVGQTLTLP